LAWGFFDGVVTISLLVDALPTRLPDHVTMATTNPKLSAFIWSVTDRILTMIGGLSH
jgi:hypothetical protein